MGIVMGMEKRAPSQEDGLGHGTVMVKRRQVRVVKFNRVPSMPFGFHSVTGTINTLDATHPPASPGRSQAQVTTQRQRITANRPSGIEASQAKVPSKLQGPNSSEIVRCAPPGHRTLLFRVTHGRQPSQNSASVERMSDHQQASLSAACCGGGMPVYISIDGR